MGTRENPPITTKNQGNYIDNTCNTAELRIKKGVLIEDKKRKRLVKEWESTVHHLTNEDVEVLLKEAKRRARFAVFKDKILDTEDPPELYENAPRNLNLKEFIANEWLKKGFNPNDYERGLIGAYDKKLVRAIENYEYNHGLLPEELRFPKTRNRLSKHELKAA